ncbi:hypothetical protein J3Q64DRAFT_1477547 [Phycomyces blakesleeanus]|uniref:Uncharacterized protein n=1 Tax=Phycomyces blakesleeanus TaxID=4837 RepID=A0ABR3B0T8_PHYBL
MPSLPRLLENDCLFSRQFNPENPLTHLPFGSRLITFAAKEKLKLLLSKQRYSEAFQLLRGLLKIRFYKPKAFWKVCAEIVQHLAPYDLAGFLYAAFISSSASNGMVILETWINCLLNSDRTQEALEELDRLIDIQPYNTNVELWRIYAMLKFTEWKEKADAIKFQSETNSGDENEDEDEDEEEDDEDIEDRKKRLNYPAATRLLSIVSKASEMVPGDTQLRGAQLELLQYLKDFKNKTNLMRRIYRYAISRRDPGQMSLLLYYWPETEIGSSEWKRVAVSVCNWDPIANVNVALRPLIENLKKCLPGKHVHVDSSHKNQFLVHKYPRTLQNSSDKNRKNKTSTTLIYNTQTHNINVCLFIGAYNSLKSIKVLLEGHALLKCQHGSCHFTCYWIDWRMVQPTSGHFTIHSR